MISDSVLMMMKIRFTSMFLLGLLLVMSCTKDPLAEARRQGPTADAEAAVPIQKDVAGGLAAAAGTRKMRTAGRKTVVDHALRGRSSKISGMQADLSDIERSSNHKSKASKYAGTLGNPRRDEAVKWVHPPSSRVTKTAIDDEPSPPPPPPPPPAAASHMKEKTLDTQLEAAEDEIVNLFHRDYTRGPPKAKRKPPINNHEPSH